MSAEEETETPEDARCFSCGAPTDIRLGDVRICERCYEVRSSCCAEFEEEGGEGGDLKVPQS